MDNISASDTPIKLDGLIRQLSAWLDNLKLGAPSLAGTNIERMNKLKELIILRPKNEQHPILKQLFNWLSDPQRTADEFVYVIGLLRQKCEEDIGCGLYLPYLGKVALEALAIQCPVLEGAWEQSALLVLDVCGQYVISNHGFTSEHLSAWIIYVIGDPDVCPNLYLRTKLLLLFVYIVVIDDQNRALALQSVMSACSALSMEDGKEYLNIINPFVIPKALKMFEKDSYLLEFDQRLSEKLQNMKSMSLSDILHDVSYTMRINPNRYTEPKELLGLTALLKITAGYAKLAYKTFQEGRGLRIRLKESSVTLHMLITNFIKSCQMPQMIDVTALCIVDIVELVLLTTTPQSVDQEKWHFQSLMNCEKVLKELCAEDQSITNSPVGQEIIRNHYKRVCGVRTKLKHINENQFPTLYALVFSD